MVLSELTLLLVEEEIVAIMVAVATKHMFDV